MDTSEQTLDLSSIGAIACDLQLTPARIAQAATELGICPSITLNRVPFYSGADVERIYSHVKAGQAQRQKQGQ